MTSDHTNDAIAEWCAKNFPNASRVDSTLGLAEETGEVCRAVLKQAQRLRGTFEDWDEEIKKELGDVYIKLVQISSLCGWDLNDLVLDRWDTIKRRNWIKDPTGHGISNYDYETEGLGGT